MSDASRILLVYITAPDGECARRLGATLVRERHAACANIIDGLASCYWWQGEVETAVESLCLCKTTARAYPGLEARAKELHPYETPCIVALPLGAGYAPFLRWVDEETNKE
jgi:periplasmic divalent cation tolerance protein